MKDYTLDDKTSETFPDGFWELQCDYGSADIYAEPEANEPTNYYYYAIYYTLDERIGELKDENLGRLAGRIYDELEATIDRVVKRAEQKVHKVQCELNRLKYALAQAQEKADKVKKLAQQKKASFRTRQKIEVNK